MEDKLLLMTDAGKLDTSFAFGRRVGSPVSACLAVLSRTWRNSQKRAETADDESFRFIYTMPRRRRRRIYLWRPRRGESGSSRQSLQVVENQADPHPPRTGRRIHGRDLRPPYRPHWRLPRDPGARRGQLRHSRRLRPTRRHADDDDYRPKADQNVEAGPLPNSRRSRHDAADHEIHA